MCDKNCKYIGKYALIGSYITYTPNSYTGESEEDEIKSVLAIFDTDLDAYDYIEKSKLKHPKRGSWRTDQPFKKRSLLRNYTYAEVEEILDCDYCVAENPEI